MHYNNVYIQFGLNAQTVYIPTFFETKNKNSPPPSISPGTLRKAKSLNLPLKKLLQKHTHLNSTPSVFQQAPFKNPPSFTPNISDVHALFTTCM